MQKDSARGNLHTHEKLYALRVFATVHEEKHGSERERDAGMFCRMLRDDGNRMANVRRDHKVKVKRRDKLGKVSDVPRPAAGKRNIEIH